MLSLTKASKSGSQMTASSADTRRLSSSLKSRLFQALDESTIPAYGYGAIFRRANGLSFDPAYYPTGTNYGDRMGISLGSRGVAGYNEPVKT